MLARGKAFVLPVLFTAAFAGSAAAQAACEVSEDRPGQVGRAFLSITQAAGAQEAGNWAQSATALKSAVKGLSEKNAAGNNPTGHAMVLGKALSMWLNHPDVPAVTTWDALGAQGNTQQVDVLVAVDSLFDVVETAQPACVSALSEWRRQRAWVQMLNASIEHLNANRLDSAEYVAGRANRLFTSPYGYMVLGNVAQNRRENDKALEYYRQTVDASTDSVYADVRDQTLVTMGNLAADMAEDTTGEARVTFARRAVEAYNTVMQKPTSTYSPQARAGLGRALLLQGDTTAFRNSLKDHLENPTAYPYQDVLASAVAAARAGQWKEGVQLFEGALQSNPWNRDALYNAALGYHELGEFDKMIPHVRKLVAVDPGNGENWRLFAYAFNGMSKASKVAAQQRALNDSVVKYYEVAEKMPHQVQFSEFGNSPERTTLSGTITNKGTAAASYTIKFEFLDKNGQVVASREATVADVAPQASGRFSVRVEDAPTAVAFRYAPIG